MRWKKILAILVFVLLVPSVNAAELEANVITGGSSGDDNDSMPDLQIDEGAVKDALKYLSEKLGLEYWHGRCFGTEGEKDARKYLLDHLPNAEEAQVKAKVKRWINDDSYKLIVTVINLTTNKPEPGWDHTEIPCFPLIGAPNETVITTQKIETTDIDDGEENKIMLYEKDPNNPYKYASLARGWKLRGFSAFIMYDSGHSESDYTFFMAPPSEKAIIDGIEIKMPIPGLSILGKEGRELKKFVEAPSHYIVNITFIQRNTYREVSTSNVISVIPGKDHSKCIVVSAHYDGWWGQCAVDDASGVAAMIGIAKAFENAPQPRYDIIHCLYWRRILPRGLGTISR